MGGGDWSDASVNHLILLKDINLEDEKKLRDEWYEKEYLPALRSDKNPEYYTFPEWLVKKGLARETTEDEVSEFYEGV